MVRGSCLCGAIAFEFSAQIEFRNCHCSRCRKAHGSAFASNVFVRPSDFTWIRGHDHLVSYKLPNAERFGNDFCRICGSPMPRFVAARDFLVVPAGSLEGDPGTRPACHIFVGSRAPWHTIADDLPQHREYPPAR